MPAPPKCPKSVQGGKRPGYVRSDGATVGGGLEVEKLFGGDVTRRCEAFGSPRCPEYLAIGALYTVQVD